MAKLGDGLDGDEKLAKKRATWMFHHEPHEEAVVADVVALHDDLDKQVPDAAVVQVVEQQRPRQVVGVVRVALGHRHLQRQEARLAVDVRLFAEQR